MSKQPADSKIADEKQSIVSLEDIIPDMKGKTNIGAQFKEENKEAVEHFDKKENDSAEFQAMLQIEV